MIRISELIKKLEAMPPDALAYAYEGEFHGVVIVSAKTREQVGEIEAGERGGEQPDAQEPNNLPF